MQGEPLLPETVALGQERRHPELAIEPVHPRVVRAPDRTLESPVRHARVIPRRRGVKDQAGAAMPADVVVGAQSAGPRPHDQHALAGDVDVEVVAGAPERLRSTDEEPLAVEDRVRLSLEPGRRPVRRTGEGLLHPGFDHVAPRGRWRPRMTHDHSGSGARSPGISRAIRATNRSNLTSGHGREPTRSPSTAESASWPHAASMFRPRVSRTVTLTPARSRTETNRRIRAGGDPVTAYPGVGFSGIR